MKKIILIMGLPGAGKTYLARRLVPYLKAFWLNNDEVRKEANDWDFSPEGRQRQAKRMKDLAEKALSEGKHVIADFICPTPKTRKDFNADIVIWVDTIKKGRFEDTNKMFIEPKKFDFRVTEKNAKKWSLQIFEDMKKKGLI
jgi:adenylylsulfate kinase